MHLIIKMTRLKWNYTDANLKSQYTNSDTLMHLNEGAKTLKVKKQNPRYEDSILSSQIRQQ